MKTCYKCKEEKNYSEFNKNKSNKDGYQDGCRMCTKIHYQQNKEQIKAKTNKYRIENKEKLNEYWKSYRELNNKKVKQYRAKSKNKNREKNNKYERERRQNNPLYRLKGNIRTAIWKSLKRKGYSKKSRTEEILGCSFTEFQLHIESQWTDWMTWDNHGKYNGNECYGWDVDHIIRLETALNENEVVKLNHFTNLQPLCSYINRDIKR
jgi:hypothetical protein